MSLETTVELDLIFCLIQKLDWIPCSIILCSCSTPLNLQNNARNCENRVQKAINYLGKYSQQSKWIILIDHFQVTPKFKLVEKALMAGNPRLYKMLKVWENISLKNWSLSNQYYNLFNFRQCTLVQFWSIPFSRKSKNEQDLKQ